MAHDQRFEVTPSWTALFRIILVILATLVTWKLKGVIIIVLLATMLSSALYPTVRYLTKWVSLTVASIITLAVLTIPLISTVAVIIPNFIQQFPSLLKTLNVIVVRSTFLPQSLKQIDFTQYAESSISYLLNSSAQITGFIATIITILFMTLYMLIDSQRLRRILFDSIPLKRREDYLAMFRELYVINGHYIRGNLLISVTCATIISTGLLALNVPYAVPLGILAGILDLLPLIGALTGSIPSLIIAFAVSPTTGILTLVLFILYQQFENNILAPSIYKRVLDLSPSLSLLSVVIGATLFGMSGAFIALPIAASLPTVLAFLNRENLMQKGSKTL